MDAFFHLAQAVFQAAGDGVNTELQPFTDDLQQILLCRTAVHAHHHQIDGNIDFQAGLREQGVHQLFAVDAAGLGFKHQAHRASTVRLVAHVFQLRQQQFFLVDLFLGQFFLAVFELGIGLLFDFGQDFLSAHARR